MCKHIVIIIIQTNKETEAAVAGDIKKNEKRMRDISQKVFTCEILP